MQTLRVSPILRTLTLLLVWLAVHLCGCGAPVTEAATQVRGQELLTIADEASGSSPLTFTAGQIDLLTLKANGGTPAYRWTVASGSLPAGLLLQSNGLLYGAPLKSGQATVTVAVKDSGSPAQTQTRVLRINVLDKSVPALTIVDSTLNAGQQGSAYIAALLASGGKPGYMWTVVSGTLPPGLDLLPNSGLISGVPNRSGRYNFTVSVVDAGSPQQAQQRDMSIVVAPPPLTLATTSLVDAKLAAAYTANLVAKGGTPAYTYAVASGTLPPGLSLSNMGVLSGTPTASGVYAAVVSVADAGTPQQSMTQLLTLTVASGPQKTLITHYLSPTGNDSNDGLTPQSPWWSPNHAGLTCGVDQILALPSAEYGKHGYTQFYADWGKVNCPGGDNVVWLRCAQAFACKDISQPLGMTVNESYWGVAGFQIVSSQYPGFSAVSSTQIIHHIIFANNVCKHCGGAGFSTFSVGNSGADYVNIVGNIAYDSALSDGICGSGISIAAPVQSDSATGTHMFIAGNFSLANMNSARCAGTAATDGNGIILDTFEARSYSMQSVVSDNLLVGNGGRGLEILRGSAPVYTQHNTMWGNNTDAHQSTSWAGEYLVATANHVTSSFDLSSTKAATAYGDSPLSAFYLVGTDSTTLLTKNWATAISKADIVAGSAVVTADNVLGVNPLFHNASPPTEPSCDASPTTVSCMEEVIANFSPAKTEARSYGYRRPSALQEKNPLFPQWLCKVALPDGIITSGCR